MNITLTYINGSTSGLEVNGKFYGTVTQNGSSGLTFNKFQWINGSPDVVPIQTGIVGSLNAEAVRRKLADFALAA